MNNIYESFLDDIHSSKDNQLFGDVIIRIVRESYVHSIDAMIVRLEKAEERANKLYEESKMVLDQTVACHSRNLKRDLERERSLIISYEK